MNHKNTLTNFNFWKRNVEYLNVSIYFRFYILFIRRTVGYKQYRKNKTFHDPFPRYSYFAGIFLASKNPTREKSKHSVYINLEFIHLYMTILKNIYSVNIFVVVSYPPWPATARLVGYDHEVIYL